MDIKPIETRYKGYRFRSRLEARWAVFFDALGIRWEYEKEGFDLGDFGWYLPDFYLPEWESWIEIKPTLPTKEEFVKFTAFVAMRQNPNNAYHVLEHYMLCGNPGIPTIRVGNNGTWKLVDGYVAMCPTLLKRRTGFSSMHKPDIPIIPVEPGELDDEESEIFCAIEAFAFVGGGKRLDIWPLYATTTKGVGGDLVSSWLNSKGVRHEQYWSFLYPQGMSKRYYIGDGVEYGNMALRLAYTAARSARFEHGEVPG